GTRAALVDDGEVGVEALGEGARALDAAGVGRDDGDLALTDALLQVLEEHRVGVDVVHRDVEEALDLSRMEIYGEDARRTGGGDEVGDELGADGDAGCDLPILAGVAEVRYHRGDPARRRPLEGVEHEEQLHQVVVGGSAEGLDDEDVTAADVL